MVEFLSEDFLGSPSREVMLGGGWGGRMVRGMGMLGCSHSAVDIIGNIATRRPN